MLRVDILAAIHSIPSNILIIQYISNFPPFFPHISVISVVYQCYIFSLLIFQYSMTNLLINLCSYLYYLIFESFLSMHLITQLIHYFNFT